MEVLGATSCALSQYQVANETYSYQLDGRQQIMVSQLFGMRAAVLESSFKLGGIDTGGWGSTIVNTGAIFRCLAPFVIAYTDYVQQHKDAGDRFHYGSLARDFAKKVSTVCVTFCDAIDKLIEHATPLFETICVISYIAIIFFGSPIVGGIGLIGILLTRIKQSGNLPAIADRVMTPLAYLANFYSICISPIFILWKFLGLLFVGNDLLNFLISNNTTRPYLPDFLTNGTPGVHTIHQEHALDHFLGDRTNVETILGSPAHSSTATSTPPSLKMNLSYIHAKEVSETLPPLDREALDKLKMQKLYDDIERRITRKKIVIKERKGWEILKKAMISESPRDARPPNFEETMLIIKAILLRADNSEDDSEFEMLVQELAVIGNSCNEGWLRDAGFLLNPSSKNIKWMVHHILSIARGQEVLCLIKLFDEGVKEALKYIDFENNELNMDMVGGSNNIHLLNQVEAALWHKLRTFNGEVYFNSVHGRGALTRWYHRDQAGNNEPMYDRTKTALGWRNLKHILFISSHIILPLPIPAFMFAPLLLEFFNDDLLPENLIERIYDANKPEYRNTTTGDGSAVAIAPVRKIQWEAIQGWLADLDERCSSKKGNPFSVVSDDGDYNSLLVERDLAGNYHLTKQGVMLLLWDIGVLEECSMSDPDKIGVKTSPFGQGVVKSGITTLITNIFKT